MACSAAYRAGVAVFGLLSLTGAAPSIGTLASQLRSPDLPVAIRAAKNLAQYTTYPAATEALVESLQMGAPRPLLVALLSALAQHADPRTLPLLRHFCNYRYPEVRIAALRALARLATIAADRRRTADAFVTRQVGLIVVDALGDSHADVRAQAARWVVSLDLRSAEPTLARLTLRGDRAAAEALAEIGDARAAEILTGDHAPRAAAALLVVALGGMLARQDFGPDPLRLRVVRALLGLKAQAARRALAEYVASVPAGEKRESKRVAERALADGNR